jgi:hypothetical protein
MQANKIAASATEKVEAAGPAEMVRLLLRLSDLLLTDAEMEFVRGLGGEIIVDSARLVAVMIPGRHLGTLAAHLPSVKVIE